MKRSLIFLGIIIGVGLLIRTFCGGICMVSSNSMEPTLLSGDWVWMDKFTYGVYRSPRKDEIVVVRTPHHPQLLIKRIVDVAESPGENYYFVEGDNRENSYDSWSFGYISEKEIIGRVKNVLFSVSSDFEGNRKKIRTGRFFCTVK